MKYTTLPHTDIKVSKICLGTMTFGEQNTEVDGHEQMDYALANGVNFFDTAEIYAVPIRPETYGRTEEIIGTWFKKNNNREQVVLASKIVGPGAHTMHVERPQTYSDSAIEKAIAGSLKRLQTDYIDLYQIHWPERKANFFGKRGYQHDEQEQWKDNFHEILHSLDKHVRSGKIRHIGISNETSWGANRYLQQSEQYELSRPITIQNPYSLLNRTFEEGLAEISIRQQLGLLVYSPMAFGILSGKYLNGVTPAKGRVTLFPNLARYNSDNCTKATEQYLDIAVAHQVSLAQLSLAFVNTRPFVTSNIIGATTIEQLKEDIDSIYVEITPEILEQVNAVHDLIPNPAP